jgi:mRNA-degrading endonuclease toxin of MazEF toxin-antitoxin module
MKAGELYWANIPFISRPGGKIRPVLIIKAMTAVTVLVLTSTSQFKTNLTLIHSVDFDSHQYQRVRLNGLSGTSFFYEENLRAIEAQCLGRYLGVLRRNDWNTIYAHVSRMIQGA